MLFYQDLGAPLFYLVVCYVYCLILSSYRFFVPFSYRSAAEIFREFLLLSHIIPHRFATFKDRWFHSFVKEALKFYLLLSHPLPLSFLDLGSRSSCGVGELWQPETDVPEDSPSIPFSSCGLFYLWHHHRIIRIICIASASPLPPVFKLASVVSCRFTSLSVLSPTAHTRAAATYKSCF